MKAGDVIAAVESALLKGADGRCMQFQRSRDKNDAEQEADQRRLEELAMLSESSGSITAPITGVAGLRLAEPGNMVRLTDPIVTIVQMQPIAVVFTLPQDFLAPVRLRMGKGAELTVEAWNRDSSVKIATGHLTAIDNQIDDQTGTVKLKATFENKDNALFPNQFVNVRLLVQ